MAPTDAPRSITSTGIDLVQDAPHSFPDDVAYKKDEKSNGVIQMIKTIIAIVAKNAQPVVEISEFKATSLQSKKDAEGHVSEILEKKLAKSSRAFTQVDAANMAKCGLAVSAVVEAAVLFYIDNRRLPDLIQSQEDSKGDLVELSDAEFKNCGTVDTRDDKKFFEEMSTKGATRQKDWDAKCKLCTE